MNKSAWTIAKLNLKNIRAPYIATGLLFFALLVQDVVKIVLARGGSDIGEQYGVSLGHYLWLLVVLAAIIIPAKNYRRIMNLGGKRSHFFAGSFLAYVILSAAVSLVGVGIFYFYDRFVMGTGTYMGIFNLIEVWGWSANGAIVAFLRQFVFLLLVAAFAHTLTTLQGLWLGYAADFLLVAVIAVFTPIAPLRAALYHFFRAIIFHPSAIVQTVNCLVLAGVLYVASYPVLCRKKI